MEREIFSKQSNFITLLIKDTDLRYMCVKKEKKSRGLISVDAIVCERDF